MCKTDPFRKTEETMTKHTEHTPGPWKVCANGFRVMSETRDDDGGIDFSKCKYICDTANNKATRIPENAANARLIAAAPQMLEALQAILSKLSHKVACGTPNVTEDWAEKGSWNFANCKCDIAQIRAAIKAAIGDK